MYPLAFEMFKPPAYLAMIERLLTSPKMEVVYRTLKRRTGTRTFEFPANKDALKPFVSYAELAQLGPEDMQDRALEIMVLMTVLFIDQGARAVSSKELQKERSAFAKAARLLETNGVSPQAAYVARGLRLFSNGIATFDVDPPRPPVLVKGARRDAQGRGVQIELEGFLMRLFGHRKKTTAGMHGIASTIVSVALGRKVSARPISHARKGYVRQRAPY